MKNQILLLGICCLLTSACSNQYRDGDAGVSSEEVLSMLGEISAAQASSVSGNDVTGAVALKDQEGARIYFAQSKNARDAKRNMIDPMGPIGSILSLSNLDFIGLPDMPWQLLSTDAMAEARVFFIDVPSADGTRQNSLIIGTRKAGETALTYAGFTGTGTMSDDEFTATFAQKLILRSYDIEDGDFAGVIQMLVWDFDGAGEYYNGKLSTLIGFGD